MAKRSRVVRGKDEGALIRRLATMIDATQISARVLQRAEKRAPCHNAGRDPDIGEAILMRADILAPTSGAGDTCMKPYKKFCFKLRHVARGAKSILVTLAFSSMFASP